MNAAYGETGQRRLSSRGTSQKAGGPPGRALCRLVMAESISVARYRDKEVREWLLAA